MNQPFYIISGSDGPVVATAIHEGHLIRPVLNAYIGLSAKQRLREEDPYTGQLASLFDNHIIGNYSRFEVDLNRPRNKAVYLKPEDAWGLSVWRESLPQDEVEQSLQQYDQFYAAVRAHLQKIIDQYGFVIVYDLHSYNHRRGGPQATPADPKENPEINIGLGNMDLDRWRGVLDTFTNSFKNAYGTDKAPDIRENVKFDGGHFMRWIHEEFGTKACAIAIEFKKTFMDEWTNEVNSEHLNQLGRALKATRIPVQETATLLFQRPELNDRGSYRTTTTANTPDKERQKHK